jgi:NhaP-type Na+/H+ or K+/H+ antiporter
VATLGIVGAVVIIAALLSGLVERSGVPQVAVLLALGAALGPAGLGVVEFTLDSPVVRVVATVALGLVLFTDALTIDLGQVRRHAGLTALVLGPGTLLTAGLNAVAAWWLLDLAPAAAALVGAALASTDPVLLRGLLRRQDLPADARQALRLESGLNDAVLLPVVLVAAALLADPDAAPSWPSLGLGILLLGPGAGVVVALGGIGALELVRKRIGVRRDYESLYSLGLAFAAYAAAEAVHGSGLLAAFAAGLTIASFDVELCDCFQEYGETTAELTLLFAFVVFGGSLIWRGALDAGPLEWLFAVVVLALRPIAFLLSLAGSRVSWRSRWLLSWFGPRGLSSLLLVLLPVFAGVPGSERLFEIVSLVVLVSVVVHGGSLAFFPRLSGGAPRPAAAETEAAERLTLAELRRLEEAGEPVVLLDVRTDRAWEADDLRARGAVRLHPDRAASEAERLALPREAWLVAYCA